MVTHDAPPEQVCVSVIVTTYNHERLIEQAVRSVLEQNLDRLPGTIEILVGEDCSPDGTRAVLARLEKECAGRLTILARPANLGLSANLEDCWRRCRGKYIAILEGDDYWTDRDKLAKTAAYLDARPDFVGCWHAIDVQSNVPAVSSGRHPRTPPPDPLRFEDLLDANLLRTYSCVVYRRGIIQEFPAWHRGSLSGDWGLHLLHLARGPMGFLGETLGVYRVHERGTIVGTKTYTHYRDYFELMLGLMESLGPEFHPAIRTALRRKIQTFNDTFIGNEKIEQRYHMLGLHHVAAFCKSIKSLFSAAVRPSKGTM